MRNMSFNMPFSSRRYSQTQQKTYSRRDRARFSVFRDPILPAIRAAKSGIFDVEACVENASGDEIQAKKDTKQPSHGKTPDSFNNKLQHQPNENLTSQNCLKLSGQPTKAFRQHELSLKDKKTLGNLGDQILTDHMAVKLKDKSTNAAAKGVFETLLPSRKQLISNAEGLRPPQTPVTQPIESNIQPLINDTAHARATRIGAPKAQPMLGDQDFPIILSQSKPKSSQRQFGLIPARSIDNGSNPHPFHGASRYSGIYEHIIAAQSAGPVTSFMDKAKGALTDTTRKFAPSLANPKNQNPKGKTARLKDRLIDCSSRPSRRSMNKQANEGDYDMVISASDLETPQDNKKYRTDRGSIKQLYSLLDAGESCQNLLDGPTSESGDTKAIWYQTGRSSGEYISDNDSTTGERIGPIASSTPKNSREKEGKQCKENWEVVNHPQDEAEEGFDGDIEMLTGEDDYDIDDNQADSSNEREARKDISKTCLGRVRSHQLQTTKEQRIEAGAVRSSLLKQPKKSNGGYQNAMDIDHIGRKRSLEKSKMVIDTKRQLAGINGTEAEENPSRCKNRRLSLLRSPPQDVNELSEDELACGKYIFSPVPKSSDKAKTRPGPKSNKFNCVQQPTADYMDIDELQWQSPEYRLKKGAN
ncbi:hypothetical protein BDZ91DRAFT_712770 [Kalaharituber pfeilii]|nr:hypothetical protein BDZ91DRAFT_712770 [Kalaharituber pfeilii]